MPKTRYAGKLNSEALSKHEGENVFNHTKNFSGILKNVSDLNFLDDDIRESQLIEQGDEIAFSEGKINYQRFLISDY